VAEGAKHPAAHLVRRLLALEVLEVAEGPGGVPVLRDLGADVELGSEDFLRERLADGLGHRVGIDAVVLDFGSGGSRSLDDHVERRGIDGHASLVNDHVVLKDERLLSDHASLALLLRGLLKHCREVADLHGVHVKTPSCAVAFFPRSSFRHSP